MSETYRVELFEADGFQAVRLPEECRLEGAEVTARRDGSRIILEPVAAEGSTQGTWPESFVRSLGAVDEPLDRPSSITEVRDPLE